jgi:superkiller protein 3
LSLYLHSSPLYPVLSQLPPPDLTNPTATTTFDAQTAINNSLPVLEEIVSITERDETKLIESEVSKRRQRLGAPPPEQIRKDVDQEVLGSSKVRQLQACRVLMLTSELQLPALYEEISNHPSTTDELRRSTEGKLLRLKLRHLNALSASKAPEQKASVRKEVDSLIEGMVLLDIPDELAWSVRIEGTDAETIGDAVTVNWKTSRLKRE